MTLQELERGLELHEKRFARIEETLELHDKRLERIESTLVVQGELLNRFGQSLDHLLIVVERNSENMRVMQASMTALFERMDAFIRGLERRDGHEKPGSV